MMRLLCSLLLALASLSVFAQEKAAEAPVEHASPVVVVLFLVVFVVACVGAVGYMWWQNKNKGEGNG